MNKRYMDFVPKAAKKVTKTAAPRRVVKPAPEVEVDEFAVQEIFEERPARAGVSVNGSGGSGGFGEPKFGVIEDFSDKFVESRVEKRPLSAKTADAAPKAAAAPKPAATSAAATAAKSEAAAAKSKKIGSRMPVFGKKAPKKPAEKPKATDDVLEEALKSAENLDEKVLKVPEPHFVNTEKVTKRPLSKNVYQKKVAVPEEVPSAPVTIIHKPEKDSKVGLIVTILITIILGAAAGTVAFLLLPK